MSYKSKHIQELLNIASSTVRKWAQDFEPFMSATANPNDSSNREFSEDDLRVFYTVQALKKVNQTTDEITKKLSEGYRIENALIPEPDIVAAVDNSAGVIIVRMIEQLRQELNEYKGKDETIAQLNREIGRLEAKIEFLQQQIKSDGKDSE